MSSIDLPTPEFIKVMTNFTENVQNTFPEYTSIINKWCSDMNNLWVFCKKKYIPLSEDILSKNVTIFEEDSKTDTEFLPHIHFKHLWGDEGLSESTKDAIWGYLRLTLLAVDTTQIDLDECIQQVQELFKLQTLDDDSDTSSAQTESSSNKPVNDIDSDIPEPDAIPPIFNGVLGSIAKDLAQDMLSDNEYLSSGDSNIEDTMKRLFANPTALTSMFKKVSDKLDQKVSSGELSNTDIMRETSTLLSQMKNIPGLNKFGDMFSSMSESAGARSTESRGVTKTKTDMIKDRLRKKLTKK